MERRAPIARTEQAGHSRRRRRPSAVPRGRRSGAARERAGRGRGRSRGRPLRAGGDQAHLPDVALLDYKLPELDGVAVTHAIVREQLPTRVLLVSAFTDSGVVYKRARDRRSRLHLQGGAPRADRRTPCWPARAARTSCRRTSPPASSPRFGCGKQDDTPALTPREQEILHLIAAGSSLPQIAKELFLGLTTVKTHVQHLYEKLGVSDRAAAVASAMRRGLIE